MLKLILSLILASVPLPSINGLTITFDDGPTKHTVKILNILKKHKVRAIFCIPAGNLYNKKALAIAKRTIKEGHIICNHSVNHPNFSKLTKKQQRWQMLRSQQIFKKLLGITPKYFRPPFGIITKYMRYYIAYYGMKLLYWNISPSLDSRDWSPKTTPYQIYSKIVGNWKRMRARKKNRTGIAIFHDTHWRTVSVLEKIILRVKRGYKIKKVSYR